jgi:hypothetical protein
MGETVLKRCHDTTIPNDDKELDTAARDAAA